MSLQATAAAGLQRQMLSQRATILRPTGEPDDIGGTEGTVRAIARDVPCRATFRQGRMVEEGAAVRSRADWQVALPLGSDAAEGDILRVDGVDYHVESTNAGAAGALVLRALCVRSS